MFAHLLSKTIPVSGTELFQKVSMRSLCFASPTSFFPLDGFSEKGFKQSPESNQQAVATSCVILERSSPDLTNKIYTNVDSVLRRAVFQCTRLNRIRLFI